jgi:hypothetical protein
MFARLTLLEIDTVRTDVDSALEIFQTEIVPDLKKQPGYLGVLALSTPSGAGAVLSFWDSAEAAESGGITGFYPEVLERYMTIFKSPPGRERYEVAFAQLPMTVRT